jgi:general secretion pathway protein B
MSYILDALKKAERDRHVAKIPTLHTVHGTPVERRRPQWMWIGAAVVLVNATLLLIWFLRPQPVAERLPRLAAVPTTSGPAAVDKPPASGPAAVDKPPAPPQADKPAPASPAGAATATPAPVPFPSQASVPGPPPETTTRRVETKPSPPVAAAPASPRIDPGKPPAPVAPARPAAAVPERPAPATAVARVSPPTVPDKSASPPAAPSPAAPGERKTAQTPGLQELTPADQEGMPKMSLQFLVYSEVPGERLVFINNQKYVEGQSIEGKVVVEGIVPDGAILSYQGKRFKLHQ